MTKESRLKLAKHYASLDDAGKARQKGLKQYYDEFNNQINSGKKEVEVKKEVKEEIKSTGKK